MRLLLLPFIIIPIIEIAVLINVGDAIGTWPTVGLVLLSAFVGVNMLRYQGFSTLARAQQRAQQGEIPGQEMVEGIVLAIGGALLITPGFVTDFFGFCCLLPYTRKAVVKAMLSRFSVVAMNSSQFRQTPPDQDPFQPGPPPGPEADRTGRVDKGDVIDGEYTRKD